MPMTLRLLSVAVLTTSLLANNLLGCSKTCTLIGCVDSVSVGTSARLPERYVAEITLDGETWTFVCDATVPDSTNPDAGVIEGESGSVHSCGRNGLYIMDSPSEVTVRFLTEDGTLLGEQSFEPDYKPRSPNGEDCGAACATAATEVAVAETSSP